jgi:hypothetical protein
MHSKNKQEILIGYLKSLNRVFKLELKKDNVELLIEQLTKVSEHIKTIFNLDDKEHFESLMLSDDKGSMWGAEKYSKPFTELMIFYKNIYINSLNEKNETLCLEITIKFDELLELLTLDKESQKEFINYQQFLEIYFLFHREIFEYTLAQNSPYQSPLGYYWYTSCVFNYLNLNKEFDLAFLGMFDKQLFSYILLSIDRNHFDFFKSLIDWLHHGIGFCDDVYAGLYEFVGFGNYDTEVIAALEKKFGYITTQEELKQWLDDFNILKTKVLETEPKDEEAKEIIQKATNQYLFFNLKKLVHGVGAYLLYRQKYDWIKYLWHFKQPEDTNVQWVGHSIVPESLSQWIEILNMRQGNFYKFDFSEGHSSSSYYYERYEILLAGFILSTNKDVSFNFPKNDEVYLSRLKYCIAALEQTLNEMRKKEESLKFLEFMINAPAVYEDIADIFKNIQQECDNKITSNIVNSTISPERKKEFIDGFYEAIKKQSGLKQIAKDLTKTYFEVSDASKPKFGVNTRIQKDWFTSKLVAGIDMLGKDFGRQVVTGENRTILEKIILKCQKIEEKEFSNAVKKVPLDDALIFTSRATMFFRKSPNFEGAWRLPEDALKVFSSFEGRYVVDGTGVPVFNIFDATGSNQVLILNQKKFVQIIQYILHTTDVNNNFEIKIEELTPEQKEKILSSKTTNETVESLAKQVHLQILESFEMIIPENFEGYRINV